MLVLVVLLILVDHSPLPKPERPCNGNCLCVEIVAHGGTI